MFKCQKTAAVCLFAAISLMADAATMTFGPATFPPVPDGNDLTGLNPGITVMSDIAIGSGNNVVINSGNAVTVTLTGWSHDFIADLIIVLTGPDGLQRMVANQSGGNCGFSASETYDFNSGSPTALPTVCRSTLTGGSYKTSDSDLSSLWSGLNIDSTIWTLSAQDLYSSHEQAIAGSWSISFDVTEVPETSTFTMLGVGLGMFAVARLMQHRS